jgi:hypothetical protein
MGRAGYSRPAEGAHAEPGLVPEGVLTAP